MTLLAPQPAPQAIPKIAQPTPMRPRARVESDAPMQPLPHRWTFEEYLQLGAAGLFPDHRTELIDGEIFDVASQNNPHVSSISKTNRVLVGAFDETFWLTIQSTIRLGTGDGPDPDFAVRPGPASADNAVHPQPLLIIEVSDTTLLFDQVVKSSLYAANGVADYWIVNVNDGQVEVHRRPVADPSRRFGWRYGELTVHRPPALISPLARPEVQIDVAKMLP